MLVLVGAAMTAVFILQSYINVSSFHKLVHPLIMRDLDSSLFRSKIVFDNLYQQTVEDSHIIRSHNSLTNYLDYEELGEQQGLNEELVELEQFLSSLTASKPRYHDVEIITSKGSIIRLLDGEVTESQVTFSTNSFVENSATIEHFVYFEQLAGKSLSSGNKILLLNLDYRFLAGNKFIDGKASSVVIRISNQINQPLVELISSLKLANIDLTVLYKGDVLSEGNAHDLDNDLWLSKQLHDDKTGITLVARIKKSDAFLLVDKMQYNSILIAISLMLVVGASQLITIRILIAKPLKKIIGFINEYTLQSGSELVRYKTNSTDEIGEFAQGLNHMLDQIQNRGLALKSSEERLGMALWGSGEGLWEYRLGSNVMFLDNMSCQIMGLSNNEGITDFTVFISSMHIEDRVRVEKYFAEFSNHTDNLFEIKFRVLKQQKYIWLQLKGKIVASTQEDISNQTVLGTFRDITESIESEEQIRLYAKAFDSSSSAILILDKKLVVLAANGAFTQITGFTFKHVVGRIPDFIINSNESSFNIRDFTHNIEAYGKWQNELIGTCLDGSHFVQEMTINVIVNSDQSPSHYVCAFSDITLKKKSEDDLWNLANHDILTDLPNRGYFRKTLDKVLSNAIRTDENVVLFFIDLDRFKQVNDTLGHETGDELLRKVARILSKVARKNDYVARLGGDEFAIILEGVSENSHIERIAENLIKTFTNGLLVDDKDTGVGLSIGISIFPTDTNNSDDLVHFADTAMYFSKTSGTNQYHFFDSSMSDHVNRRNLLEKELRVALKNDALSLYFQPQIDVETGGVVSFEALSRWFHPELGTINPDEFIAIAEDAGLIVELGQQALIKACKQLKEWHKQGFNELRMAINVSPRQFLLSDVALDVETVLRDVGLEAKYVELELTESLILDDPEKIIIMLNKLKELGVKLSIDDFGTGYSSLSYLSRFPLDVLKIDKSFINQLMVDEKGLAITQAIIAIAHSLKLEVIAEGVENAEQLDILRRLGCKYVQGYYFGKPVSAKDTLVFLKDYNQFNLATDGHVQI